MQINKYNKIENYINFRNINSDFNFSLIKLDVAYEYPNTDFHNFITINFEVTRTNNKIDEFLISFFKINNNSLFIRQDSKFENIKLNILMDNEFKKVYLFKFDKNKNKANVTLKIGGRIFGGNQYHKEFILYLDIDAPKNLLEKIKIQPILNAVENVSLIDKSILFDIGRDNPFYRESKIVSADKFHNLFFRFIDLQKQGEYQTRVIIYSTIIGVLLSVLINLLFKLTRIYFIFYKRNE